MRLKGSLFSKGLLVGFLITYLVGTAHSGDVPRPFENPNRRVELASGENYVLQGRLLVQKDGDAWIYVDLREHSWLANRDRLTMPYYKIESQLQIDLKKYQSHIVQIPVRAKGHVVRDLAKGYVYQIYLELLSAPKIVERGKN